MAPAVSFFSHSGGDPGAFAKLSVETGSEPLRLDGFSLYSTGYPFAQRARFDSSDPELILEQRV